MKSTTCLTSLALSLVLLISLQIIAQRPRTVSRKAPDKPASFSSPTQPQATPMLNGLPILLDSSSLIDTAFPKSLKPTGLLGSNKLSRRTPLPYENLRWDDVLYAQTIWRELDLHEKMNQTFRYDDLDEHGSTLFINILLRAVRSGTVQAFRDERFSTVLTNTDLISMISGETDTVPKYDLTTMAPIAYVVTRTSFDPKSVIRILLKEQWVFDSKTSRLYNRIIGLAPLKSRLFANGKMESSVMFWVSYGDLRSVLANEQVYNTKNMGRSQMTWEELFESRMFSSYITKSTIDNPSNTPIRALIKDPILALLEGDNIKQKIFNYEQDLWSD